MFDNPLSKCLNILRTYLKSEATMSKHVSAGLCLRGDVHTDPGNAELLLVCEGGGRGSLKNHEAWQLPGGKCCMTVKTHHCCEETPEETLMREFTEETGLTCSVGSILLTQARPSSYGGRFDYHVFKVEITGGAMLKRKVMRNFESPMWFKLSELPPWIYSSHQYVIKRLLGPWIRNIPVSA
jgi:8-oxo-dGTP pyrophosphatase MutT (NUDIX family)